MILFSYLFYAWGEPVWVILLLLASMLGYLFGLGMERFRGTRLAKVQYVAAIAINIGLLGTFKYAGFLVENINLILPLNLPVPEVKLPIGISFFTFELICYLTDVYKGTIRAPRSPKKVLFYVSFFPHLVAGPIIRYTDIERQIEHPRVSLAGFSEGISRFLFGLGKKVLLANLLGETAAQLLNPGSPSSSVLGMWFGITLFALQIYFDFSGYSDMAIGLGKMFGFNLRENFNYPYISKSAGEFWRRWNMSLGGFFRDYVYIPLGGNQKSYLRNLFVVWFLTGFWHGASWNFIIWGLYFGTLIYLERRWLLKWLGKLPAAFAHLYAVFTILIGWVWFYFTNLTEAAKALLIMFGLYPREFANLELQFYFRDNLLLCMAAMLLSTPLVKRGLQRAMKPFPKLRSVLMVVGAQLLHAAILILATILLVGSSYNPFLYYRF
ncbi:MBOAT family O-acyltransferase [Fontibacillus phaseoli]|uniref:MBOAT family O-acyltransferase n=1 Tax=Fontibacillus phaseoli TaxID=1416533 RepID=UPI001FE7B457|nr:MBOAT family O-acyltransferase [Fontibacillus phaseoli]